MDVLVFLIGGLHFLKVYNDPVAVLLFSLIQCQ